jgi:hypothetical protein
VQECVIALLELCLIRFCSWTGVNVIVVLGPKSVVTTFCPFQELRPFCDIRFILLMFATEMNIRSLKDRSGYRCNGAMN